MKSLTGELSPELVRQSIATLSYMLLASRRDTLSAGLRGCFPYRDNLWLATEEDSISGGPEQFRFNSYQHRPPNLLGRDDAEKSE
jgi:hypothetical protein